MNNPKNKLLLTIFMFMVIGVTMTLGLLGYGGSYANMALGLVASVLLTIRMFMQRRWMQHAGKAVRSGKAGDHTKRTYILSIFLFKIWFIAILSGILVALGNFGIMTPIEGLGTVHGMTAAIGTTLLVVYVGNHFYNEKLYKTREKATDL